MKTELVEKLALIYVQAHTTEDMGNDEKKLCQRLAQAVEMLPDEKREFILGYAEGVIAMANSSLIPHSSAICHAVKPQAAASASRASRTRWLGVFARCNHL